MTHPRITNQLKLTIMWTIDNYELRVLSVMDEYGCEWAEAEYILSVQEWPY